MSRINYLNLSTAQTNGIVEALNANFEVAEVGAILEVAETILSAIPAGVLPAATTTVNGVVKKSAAVTTSATAAPAAAPAGGTGSAAGGWDTAVNRDAAIVTINGNRALVIELQTQLNDLLAKLRTAGVLTP